jgi:hypothetical protein
MKEQPFQPIPNPELADFLRLNPTPSLSYLPDTNRDWYINLYLKDRRENLLDLAAADPLDATFSVYPEGRNRILRVELFPSEGAPAYWAETEFLLAIPDQVDAFRRLLNQTNVELTMVDDRLYYLTTKLYSNDPLRRFRNMALDFT